MRFSRDAVAEEPHLVLRGESPSFSRVEEGNFGFLSSCDGDFRDHLGLPQESQVSMRVARGISGFLSGRYMGLGPHLKLRPEPQASSPGLT